MRLESYLLGVAMLASLCMPTAAATTIQYECNWNETWALYDCSGLFSEPQGICDVIWTDDDANDDYTDENAKITSKKCNDPLTI